MLTFVISIIAVSVSAQSIFIPENGKYEHSFESVTRIIEEASGGYLKLKDDRRSKNSSYKLDRSRQEYVIKDWFREDWFSLQKMFSFSPSAYLIRHGGQSFNEAKRREYSQYPFHKKKYYHLKTMPSLKEWGGLTHPPFQTFNYPLELFDRNFSPLDYRLIQSPYFSASFQREVDQASRSELTFGNNVFPIADKEAFQKKLAIIRSARESILMSSLVFVCDESTRTLVSELIKKHREGVDVKIIVDGFISKALGHTACLKEMANSGIEVIRTTDFFKHKLKAIYHTKTLVVDSLVAVAGGHNMLDADNASRGTDFKNRDIDLLIEGPIVSDITRQFAENWEYQRKSLKGFSSLESYLKKVSLKEEKERKIGIRGESHYQRILQDKEERMNGVCRFIKQAPYEDRHTIGKAYLLHLEKVKTHLVIENPIKTDTYVKNFLAAPLAEKFDNFDMFNKLHLKVKALAKAGLKIDYITTNINMAGNENVAMMNERIREQLDDGKKVGANWSLAKLTLSNSYYGKPHYENLLKDWHPFPNVHIWKHMSFMHSKVFYFDRVAASVGSYNFQHNATDQAYESTVICMDERLNRELDRILVHDMANSIPLIFSKLR